MFYIYFQEILSPIYFVAIICAIKLTISPESLDPITSFPEVKLVNFKPPINSSLFVAPNSSHIKTLIEDVAREAGVGYQTFADVETVEAEYKKKDLAGESSHIVGIIFVDEELNDVSYKLRYSLSAVPSPDLRYVELGKILY